MVGGAGIDLLQGMAGADEVDSVDGVAGNDLVVGGAGRDVCSVDEGDHVRGCERVRTFEPASVVSATDFERVIARLQARARLLTR